MATNRNRDNRISYDADEAREAARARLAARRGEHAQPSSPNRRAKSQPIDPRVVIVAAAVLVAIVAAVFLVRSCAAPAEVAEPADDQAAAEQQAEPEPEQADFSNLPEGLDADVVSGLTARADAGDERVAHIVNNAAALAVDGAAEQAKLLKLAAIDPEAIDFVLNYPDRYPQQAGEPLSGGVEKGTIPLLMQWDMRWGYVRYCGAALGNTGCAPTSLAMVYAGLTGKTDKTPADLAALAESLGYAVDGEGTVGDFLPAAAPDLGLICEEFWPSSQYLRTYLESGYVVIVNVGPGDFTTAGHFFVATGLADDGSVRINDPYSSVRSAQTWDADRIANQSIAMYAFKIAS